MFFYKTKPALKETLLRPFRSQFSSNIIMLLTLVAKPLRLLMSVGDVVRFIARVKTLSRIWRSQRCPVSGGQAAGENSGAEDYTDAHQRLLLRQYHYLHSE
jgi:hypothetical protein